MLNNSHSILACCPTINVKLTGDAFKYKGSRNGVYYMQSGFSNGQCYWMSSEGNAIWIKHTGNKWYIGDSEDLGTTTVALYVSIKDPNKECPHDNLKSNWRYDPGGDDWAVDVSDSVRINCLKGNNNT